MFAVVCVPCSYFVLVNMGIDQWVEEKEDVKAEDGVEEKDSSKESGTVSIF